MNKWQLIVLWAMVGAICFVVLSAPKYVSRLEGKFSTEGYEDSTFIHFTNWDYVARYSIPILLIGISLILTLRTKKR